MLREGSGYSREFVFQGEDVRVADDLDVAGLRGALRVTRTPRGLYVGGRLTASMPAECVRCLTEIPLSLSADLDTLFVYPPSKATDPLEAVSEDGFIDLAPLVREGMLLSIPLQPVCRPDCAGLCPECGVNRNEETCEHSARPVAPGFAVLAELLKEA